MLRKFLIGAAICVVVYVAFSVAIHMFLLGPVLESFQP